MEIWKDIKGYEGLYQVSNLGNIKSLERKAKHFRGGDLIVKEKLLKLNKDSTGYFAVGLSKNGIVKSHKVHQLVVNEFLNHKPNGHNIVVDHINNIKIDNRLENLQLISHRENSSKDKKGYSSKYVGVCWNKNLNKWMSSVQINGKIKHIGYFISEYDAHLAYQNKLLSL